MSETKCEMAKQKYCRKSTFGYCNAGDKDLETCPYLKAMSDIKSLSLENKKLEDRFLDDGK